MSAIDADNATNFAFTNVDWMIPMFNGTLSTFSSIMTISIILRSSPESRTSSYHIIIFFMSFWDIVASTSIALNTLPMPPDVHDVYPSFTGKTIGNIGTCEAQGFLILMGSLFAVLSTIVLNTYYVCTFRYEMREENFKRRVLPFLLVIAMAASVPIPINALRMGNINPSPISHYCTAVRYPLYCEDDNIECIRGVMTATYNRSAFQNSAIAILVISFLILVFSLGLVVMTVFQLEILMRRWTRDRSHSEDISERSLEIGFRRTRTVLKQALLYIGAFLLTWVWLVIGFIIVRKKADVVPNKGVLILAKFFRPLYGFFNAMIFIHHKVLTLRQTRQELTYFKAIKRTILSPSTIPAQLISRIEIVDEDLEGRPQSDSLVLVEDVSVTERQRIAALSGGMRRLATGVGQTDIDAISCSSVNSERDPSLDPSSASSLDGFLSIDDDENDIECKVQEDPATLSYDDKKVRKG